MWENNFSHQCSTSASDDRSQVVEIVSFCKQLCSSGFIGAGADVEHLLRISHQSHGMKSRSPTVD